MSLPSLAVSYSQEERALMLDDADRYAVTVFFMIGLAICLFVVDEFRGTRPKASAAFMPVFYPDESIPWAKLNDYEYFSGLFGLGIQKWALWKWATKMVRRNAAKMTRKPHKETDEHSYRDMDLPWTTVVHAYIGYLVLFMKGILRECLWTVTFNKNKNASENWCPQWWKEFYTQHMYRRIEDCWNRPICSAPGSTVDVLVRARHDHLAKRFGKFQPTGEVQKGCINLASYNYLGFGGTDEYCTPLAIKALDQYGLAVCASRPEYGGTNRLHIEFESKVAAFLGKEDALVMGMGFATNSTFLGALAMTGGGSVAKRTLFVSDQLNHKSIVEGVKQSSAKVIGFKHNNMHDLEKILDRETRSGKWAKIVILVEGIYSMEGEFCRLRETVSLKNKYKCYLWLDEAHSIGAVGPTGRGISELFDVDTSEIDIMMGTFTKSFGSNGGYIASTSECIQHLRRCSLGWLHGAAMPPMVTAQAMAALDLLSTERGKAKLRAVRENANYLRKGLMGLNLRVIGDIDSPVICVMLIHPEKIAQFSRECLKRNIAAVVVGYPATPVILSRARFCVSASHTKEQLDTTLRVVKEVSRIVGIEYGNNTDERAARAYRNYLSEAPIMREPLPGLGDYWNPEPLVPNYTEVDGENMSSKSTSATNSPRDGRSSESEDEHHSIPLVDFATIDPLSLQHKPDESLMEIARAVVREKGVGACGPRGFYGTTVEHLDLEKAISEFLGTEAAIVYSHHTVSDSSVIQAFITNNDFAIVHKDANAHMCTGLNLSRVKNITWWSGDIDELAELVETQSKDVKLAARAGRLWILMDSNFVLVSVCTLLLQVVDIKDEFGAYLLLDDSYGIGAVGENGRGYCEYYGVPCSSIDLLVGSLEHAFGSQGGFCAGQQTTIDHQTLYGSGYCFSASSPPASCKFAAETMRRLQGYERLHALQANVEQLHQCLVDHGVKALTDSQCFAQIIEVSDAQSIANSLKMDGFAVQPVLVSPLEKFGLAAAERKNTLLRICVRADHTATQIAELGAYLGELNLSPTTSVRHSNGSSNSCTL
ncbi:serine palmitoyltransferase, putative [Perkinsus marinus ATCC 50983]|uniref:Serine palmitoyltransferase, putative n=1 Tax=Perkinsus marinus (strain ATCC 50983 / TXsc) TaxID=423536 RepID=C5LAM7_PERM5|nr:serine palmitoyltransferase, putative [Perkinsus marinus ATCC 50983]EER06483.1 serine palmitoyltransferase, putative [Perkinsus marinus ATCC 50983]|eukprot:XP_002774667.1 serine palmitoyltransferase, putative [Perkinsus marinus ATCC 50983]